MTTRCSCLELASAGVECCASCRFSECLRCTYPRAIKCRRRAPERFQDATVWPMVPRDGWCGDYEPVPKLAPEPAAGA